MSQFIKNLEIKNFKSIKHLQLDCKRVNVLIGKPNVGKSNILEAMGLFSVNYTKAEKYMSEFVRYENIANLFFDNDYSKQITISTDKFESTLNFSEEELAFSHTILDKKNSDKPYILREKYRCICRIMFSTSFIQSTHFERDKLSRDLKFESVHPVLVNFHSLTEDQPSQ